MQQSGSEGVGSGSRSRDAIAPIADLQVRWDGKVGLENELPALEAEGPYGSLLLGCKKSLVSQRRIAPVFGYGNFTRSTCLISLDERLLAAK